MGPLLRINVMLPQEVLKRLVVNSNRQDWLNCSSTPSRFKHYYVDRRMCVLRYSTEVDIFEYLKFNRASLHCDNTCAGFDSATVFSPLKELSS
jgi:hypothetical protein